MPEIRLDGIKDIAQLRKITRELMQDIHAPIQEQSRVSWLTDFIGRQILLYGDTRSLLLEKIHSEDEELYGLLIKCHGQWLRTAGYYYERHLMIPNLAHSDVVKYIEDEKQPILTIISWVFPQERV